MNRFFISQNAGFATAVCLLWALTVSPANAVAQDVNWSAIEAAVRQAPTAVQPSLLAALADRAQEHEQNARAARMIDEALALAIEQEILPSPSVLLDVCERSLRLARSPDMQIEITGQCIERASRSASAWPEHQGPQFFLSLHEVLAQLGNEPAAKQVATALQGPVWTTLNDGTRAAFGAQVTALDGEVARAELCASALTAATEARASALGAARSILHSTSPCAAYIDDQFAGLLAAELQSVMGSMLDRQEPGFPQIDLIAFVVNIAASRDPPSFDRIGSIAPCDSESVSRCYIELGLRQPSASNEFVELSYAGVLLQLALREGTDPQHAAALERFHQAIAVSVSEANFGPDVDLDVDMFARLTAENYEQAGRTDEAVHLLLSAPARSPAQLTRRFDLAMRIVGALDAGGNQQGALAFAVQMFPVLAEPAVLTDPERDTALSVARMAEVARMYQHLGSLERARASLDLAEWGVRSVDDLLVLGQLRVLIDGPGAATETFARLRLFSESDEFDSDYTNAVVSVSMISPRRLAATTPALSGSSEWQRWQEPVPLPY